MARHVWIQLSKGYVWQPNKATPKSRSAPRDIANQWRNRRRNGTPWRRSRRRSPAGAMCPSWKICSSSSMGRMTSHIWWKIKMFQSTDQSHMRHHSRTWRSDDRWWCKVDLPRPPRTLVDPEILPESQFLLRNHCGTISLFSYAYLYSWIISWSQFLVLGVITPFWMRQTKVGCLHIPPAKKSLL